MYVIPATVMSSYCLYLICDCHSKERLKLILWRNIKWLIVASQSSRIIFRTILKVLILRTLLSEEEAETVSSLPSCGRTTPQQWEGWETSVGFIQLWGRPWGPHHWANMSRATKRKHVTREVEQDLTLPQQGQTIVKVRIVPPRTTLSQWMSNNPYQSLTTLGRSRSGLVL